MGILETKNNVIMHLKMGLRGRMGRTSLAGIVHGFSMQGRALLQKLLPPYASELKDKFSTVDMLCALARDLVSTRGEASGAAIAIELLRVYEEADADARLGFLGQLASSFNPDRAAMERAWDRFQDEGWPALAALAQAAEAPRQELFRRLNLAPAGIAAMVHMREHLSKMPDRAQAAVVDADLFHVLQSWFNCGFLTLEAISWSSPASLLERVIRYEAVHDIGDWVELRRRIEPRDRRCFGFFHPTMPEEPLIFVEVALTLGTPAGIGEVLAPAWPGLSDVEADTAVFYSISNCQPGLRGISFGSFLIKQVATALKRDLPNLKHFVTLSPIPGLIGWLTSQDAAFARLAAASDTDLESHRDRLMDSAVHYLVDARNEAGWPLDPVARFHLGNGARLERLNWGANLSPKGRGQSAGLMVNYLYDLPSVERLHESYANKGAVPLGAPFQQMLQKIRTGAGKRMERH